MAIPGRGQLEQRQGGRDERQDMGSESWQAAGHLGLVGGGTRLKSRLDTGHEGLSASVKEETFVNTSLEGARPTAPLLHPDSHSGRERLGISSGRSWKNKHAPGHSGNAQQGCVQAGLFAYL